jgi:hypothetical protein
VKDRRQRFLRHADAGVAHGDDGFVVFETGREPDGAARRRVFHGIVEQVQDHLHQARGVGVERNGGIGQGQVQAVSGRLGERTRIVGGRLHRFGQRDALLAQFDLAHRDAGNFQQVVDQVAQVAHLALEHGEGTRGLFRCRQLQFEQFDDVADRRQRVA